MADSASRTGARYATPEILDYVSATHAPHDLALARAFATPPGVPAIQVGPSEGRLLHLLLRLAGARKVVEVGTLMGYSAIHLARALPADGHVWTIELEAAHAERARGNLAAAGLANMVTVLVGPGLAMLPTLGPLAPFDAVFLDADKQGYDAYAAWALAHLRTGGLLIADNAFLFGELLADAERARTMRAFHERVAAHCDSVCIPTPDGLVVGIKR